MNKKVEGLTRYIGIKIVGAVSMTRLVYCQFRGWNLPDDENGDDLGCMVQYEGDGYISWSPLKQFEDSYMRTDCLSFGLAIEAMRKGKKVARIGWNDKGINIFIVDEAKGFKRVGYDGENCDVQLQEFIAIDTTGLQTTNTKAPKSIVPWLASQIDMLALDWCIVE